MVTEQETPLADIKVENVTDGNLSGSSRRRDSSSNSSKNKSKTTPPYKEGKITEELTKVYASMGTMLMPFDPVCGQAIVENSEKTAKALDDLARENKAVRRALMHVIEGSAWGSVIAAHAPIFVTAFMHHSGNNPMANMMAGMNGEAE